MNKINKRIGNIEVRVYNDKHEIVCWQNTQGHSHCYVIAFIEGGEDEPNVRIIGTRYWDLSIEDKIDFDAIVEYFFNHMDDDDKGEFQQHYEEIQDGLKNLQNDLEGIKQRIHEFDEEFGAMLRKFQ